MAYTYDLENIPSDIYKELRPSIPLDCPRSLAKLMERCWNTDPSKRPEMKDVVIELEKIGKAEGLLQSKVWEAVCDPSKRPEMKDVVIELEKIGKAVGLQTQSKVWEAVCDLVGLPLASWAPEVYMKLGGRWRCSVFTDMVNDGPLSHGKVCVLTESLHCVLESFKVLYRNRSYCITATEFVYWAPNIESTEDKSMTDSLERKDDESPSLDGGPEHEEPLDVDNYDSDCMEKNLDDDVEKDIKDCSKNVIENCGMVNNNMSNNVEGEMLEDHFD
nr:serine/threonine-protein kinase HT1-like [Tanacetum cinerariifolium]